MKQKLYWMLSFFCFMFFFCWFVFNAFLPIWLKQVNHLSGVQIGTIFGFNAAVTMALQPFYGYILDRLGMRKNLLYFINACILFTRRSSCSSTSLCWPATSTSAPSSAQSTSA